ncbi:glycosyltransferase family 1 protein [Niabella terrae]
MKIGLDAKRAFHNGTGLGVFNRVLVDLLATHYPQHQYYLFNPKPGNRYQPRFPQVQEIRPAKKLHKLLSSAWRSKWVVADLQQQQIDLYHGTSHEIPVGLPASGIPSVVTIHDLFAELHPEDFKALDVRIYRTKTRYACRNANRIMAISETTKADIIDLYGIQPEKIAVAYQSCDPRFQLPASEASRQAIRTRYGLPEQFFLYVGSIIERKNLLNLCKALGELGSALPLPLVVIGKGRSYKEKIQQYLKSRGLDQQVIFLADALKTAGKKPFIQAADLPVIYQLSEALVYPSFYEGFGIPIVEAMSSGVPVITSNCSCMPEIGGNAAVYIDPADPTSIATGLHRVFNDRNFRQDLIDKGLENARRFAPETYVQSVMNIYQSLLP